MNGLIPKYSINDIFNSYRSFLVDHNDLVLQHISNHHEVGGIESISEEDLKKYFLWECISEIYRYACGTEAVEFYLDKNFLVLPPDNLSYAFTVFSSCFHSLGNLYIDSLFFSNDIKPLTDLYIRYSLRSRLDFDVEEQNHFTLDAINRVYHQAPSDKNDHKSKELTSKPASYFTYGEIEFITGKDKATISNKLKNYSIRPPENSEKIIPSEYSDFFKDKRVKSKSTLIERSTLISFITSFSEVELTKLSNNSIQAFKYPSDLWRAIQYGIDSRYKSRREKKLLEKKLITFIGAEDDYLQRMERNDVYISIHTILSVGEFFCGIEGKKLKNALLNVQKKAGRHITN